MATLLQINSSISGSRGHSSTLANQFVARWRKLNPGGKVLLRDLDRDPIPHLNSERMQAFFTQAKERSGTQSEISNHSDQLITELREADILVFGVPMYNFGVPSTLKAYFDHIARAGETFRYTSHGPEGMLNDKPVYIFAARGGVYQNTEADSQTNYLKTFLGFLGLKDIHFIYAEGLNLGECDLQKALLNAQQEIDDLIAA